jgi:hypothetical protein
VDKDSNVNHETIPFDVPVDKIGSDPTILRDGKSGDQFEYLDANVYIAS